MKDRLVISLEDFPEEGMLLEGEMDGSLFDIDCDALRCVGTLRYRLEARLFDGEMTLRGRLCAPFCLRCDRCLSEFDYTAEAGDVFLSFETKGKTEIDATGELREEIILALPSYPKCELVGRECKINDDFGDFRLDKDPLPGVDSATPSGNSVWDALDRFPGT